MENVMKALSEFRRNTSSYAGLCKDYEMIRTALEHADKAQGLVEALRANVKTLRDGCALAHQRGREVSWEMCARELVKSIEISIKFSDEALAAWEKE